MPRLLCYTLAVFGACATLPPARYPDHTDITIAVRCVAPSSGRVRVPASTSEIVVRSLAALPPPDGETFDAQGRRWLLYDAGTELTLRGQLRLYGLADHRRLFPDAVEWLDPQ